MADRSAMILSIAADISLCEHALGIEKLPTMHKKMGAIPVEMTPIVRGENPQRGLSLDHIAGLEPFGTLGDLELDVIALGQRLEPIALDRGKMNEHVVAAFLLDEAKALGVVKPLHFAFCQLISPPFSTEKLCAPHPNKKGKNRYF